MDPQRNLCSQLVKLRCGGVQMIVNLEEIWQTGAVLECEQDVPLNEAAEIRWEGVMLAGRVRGVEAHEFGWRVRVELSVLTPWSEALGLPAHLLQISDE